MQDTRNQPGDVPERTAKSSYLMAQSVMKTRVS